MNEQAKLTFGTEPADTLNLHSVAKFFSDSFGPQDKLASVSYWDWLCRSNPVGMTVAVQARLEGLLVGFMVLVPIRLRRHRQVVTTFYVINVLVDPQLRGRKIFDRMIDSAKAYVLGVSASWMGHPNQAACGAWRRAEMTFYEPLRPHLALPWCNLSYGFRRVTIGQDIRFFSDIASQTEDAFWRPVLDPDYLSWRYVNNPFAEYSLYTIRRKREEIGVGISRQVKRGISLQIYAQTEAKKTTACCGAFPTIVFTSAKGSLGQFLTCTPLPLRKSIPFFWTNYNQEIMPKEVEELQLVVTDF